MKPTIGLSVVAALLSAGTAESQLPAYHGNAQHTGYSTFRGPGIPTLKWRLDLQGEVISSPVLGPDGTIYLGSVIKDTLHPEHFITAVNPDGTVKWRYRTGWRDTQTQSSPAVGADGRVYVGAQDGYFHALNPDGTLAWRFAANSPVQQHPVVGTDGTVYVGMDGLLYAFTPSGSVQWTAALGTTSLPGGPALAPDGETIYAYGHSSAGPEAALYAFRRDGTLRWQFSGFYAYYPALSPATVAADGTVIVLSGQVVAISPSGAEQWRYSPSASYYNSYASLSVDPAGNVVFAFDWYLGKLNASGVEQWALEFLGGPANNELESTYSAPLIDADGNIYLGLGTGKRWTRPWGKVVRSYTPAGALRWEFPVGEGVYSSSPALAPDGTLYIGSMDGALYALADPPAAPNVIVGLTFAAGSVYGGEPASARVTLRDPAGPGGATVMISAPKIAAVRVPPSVVVPAGATFATFEVTTFRVTEPHAVEICGSYGGQSRCSVLVVEPKPSSRPARTRADGLRAHEPGTAARPRRGAAAADRSRGRAVLRDPEQARGRLLGDDQLPRPFDQPRPVPLGEPRAGRGETREDAFVALGPVRSSGS